MNQVVNEILEDWLAENDPMLRNGIPATPGGKGGEKKGGDSK
jgi:hypothetical protein